MKDMIGTPIQIRDTIVCVNEDTAGPSLGTVTQFRKGMVYVDGRRYQPTEILVVKLPVVLENGTRTWSI